MSPTSSELASLFARDLARVGRQLDAINDAHLWRVGPGVTNSAGNLLLHLNGNVDQWLVASFNRSDDARNRQAEFAVAGIKRTLL